MTAQESNRIASYAEEAVDQLALVEAQLLELERNNLYDNPDLLNELFRGIHTIKGGADFLGLAEITALAHSAEDTLDTARRRGNIDADDVERLLLDADTLRQLLHDLVSADRGDSGANKITEAVDAQSSNVGIPNAPGLFQVPVSDIRSWLEAPFDLYIADVKSMPLTDQREPEQLIEEIGYVIDANNPYILFRTVLSDALIYKHLSLPASNLYVMKKRDPQDLESNEVIFSSIDDALAKSTEANPSPGNDIPSPVRSNAELTQSNSIRVNVDLLDELMNLAGELVLTRNQLNQSVDVRDSSAIDLAAQRLDSVTSELQEAIMSTRMQPISVVLGHFHRLTRDMSRKLSKSVRLVTKGDEVELDKSIIENIGDPLTHLVRNAIDHGIELPQERLRAGKPEGGTITIGARHEAGHVVLEVSDDGRGISAERLREQAIAKDFIDKNAAEQMTEKDLLRLIFLPGFSTAEQLSDISGRGVGMDVVLTNLSRLGGTVDVETERGKGTRFKIKLPLTLTIVPSLLVSTQKETFAIPQVNLVELVRPGIGNAEKIEFVGDTALLRLRGNLLPVVWLENVLNMHETSEDSKARDCLNIVVVSAGDFQYGIVVDELTDSEEIVVKPLGGHFSNCREYAGATILGDGGAALILDVAGIAEIASLTDATDKNANSDDMLNLARDNTGDEEKLLIVENAHDEFFAVQLAYVNRIERINTANIQRAGAKSVIKHRGGIVRIFELEEGIDAAPRPDSEIAYLILFHMLGTEVAVVVRDIFDIVDAAQEIDTTTCRQPGVLGSAIILDKITLLLDLFAVVKSADASMGANEQGQLVEVKEDQRTVLVVEDSVFFQDKLRELLKSMDINVLVAEDGLAGWEFIERERGIDMVLMDVEMPRMTGLELTHRVRSDPRFASLPVVMLTSLARESDIQRGKQAGANDYLIKMDQEMVKQTVLKHLSQQMRKVA